MLDFKEIYSFKILDEIQAGKNVRVLDKAKEEIIKPANLSVIDFLKLMKKIESDNNSRFSIYVVEKLEETKDE